MCCSMTEKSYKNRIETKQKNLLKQAKFREVQGGTALLNYYYIVIVIIMTVGNMMI